MPDSAHKLSSSTASLLHSDIFPEAVGVRVALRARLAACDGYFMSTAISYLKGDEARTQGKYTGHESYHMVIVLRTYARGAVACLELGAAARGRRCWRAFTLAFYDYSYYNEAREARSAKPFFPWFSRGK